MAKLQAGYLFPEIARRRRAHQEARPDAQIISLGIGDTTEPIPPAISTAMAAAAAGLGTEAGYSGYGAEQGQGPVREALCNRLYSHVGRHAGEVFVSDGSKCDIGRLQMMFGAGTSVALQVGGGGCGGGGWAGFSWHLLLFLLFLLLLLFYNCARTRSGPPTTAPRARRALTLTAKPHR